MDGYPGTCYQTEEFRAIIDEHFAPAIEGHKTIAYHAREDSLMPLADMNKEGLIQLIIEVREVSLEALRQLGIPQEEDE